MAILITSFLISNEMHPSYSALGLKGNVFNKMTATINITLQKLVDATVDNEVEFAPDGFGTDDYIQMVNGGNDFAEFGIGDTIQITGTAANDGVYSIIDKPNNSTIRIDSTLTAATDSSCFVYVTDSITACDFYYGLIENDEAINFLSKIDGNVMRWKHDNITTSLTAMTAVGPYYSWKIGSVSIKEITPAAMPWEQYFQIEHTFYIHPFMLKTNTLTNPSTWFTGDKCLKYVFGFRGKPYPASTEGLYYKEFSLFDGNTGWLNENLNTGITNYSVASVTFKKVSDLSTQTGVLLITGDKTRVNFTINNSTDTPFSNSNTKVKVHIINIPYDDDEYIDTTTDLDDNFTFDTALNTLGAASVDGDFTKCIEDFTCTYVSTSQITCQFDVNFNSGDYTRISGYDTKKYLIAVSVQNHTKTLATTDTVTLSVSYGDYAIITGTDDAVTEFSWEVYEHPFFVSESTIAPDECFLEDERRSYCVVKIDTNSSLYTPNLRSFEVGVRLRNTSTDDTVELDSVFLDVSGNPIVNGLQYVSQEIPRAHQAMTSEDFKRVLIERDLALDDTNEWYYIVDFPFLVGWESWQYNPDVPTDFFDTTLPNDGLNNSWDRFNFVVDYQTELYVNTTIRFNGVDYIYTLTKLIIPYEYESSDDWVNPDIKSYTIGGTDISDFILGYEQTKIVCEFEYAGLASLTTNDVEIVMRLEPKNNGGRNVSTRFSSVFQLTSATQWESFDTSNKVIKSKTGNVFYGTAVIDNDLLQDFDEFDITARIYDLTVLTDGAKLKEDGDFKLKEDGDYKLLE